MATLLFLGERLGYPGIKVSLPVETVTNKCYLNHYCQQILAIQIRYGTVDSTGLLPTMKLPFVIMVSDDTLDKTYALLEENEYFGLDKSQVTLVKQGKVAALKDKHAAISKASTYVVEAKPHGHGDIHSLLYKSGLPYDWLNNYPKNSISWCKYTRMYCTHALYSHILVSV